MSLQRLAAGGAAIALLLFAGWFVWQESVRTPTRPDFMSEEDGSGEPPGAREDESRASASEDPDVAPNTAPAREDPEPRPAAAAEGAAAPSSEPSAGEEARAVTADTGGEEPPAGGAPPAGPPAPDDSAGHGTEAGAAAAEQPPLPPPEPRPLDMAPAELIARLTAPETEPIPGTSARHFVRPDQLIRFGPEPEKRREGIGKDTSSPESGKEGRTVAGPDPAGTGPSETKPRPAAVASAPASVSGSTAGAPKDTLIETASADGPATESEPAAGDAAPEAVAERPRVGPDGASVEVAAGDDGAPAVRGFAAGDGPILAESARHLVGADQPIRLGTKREEARGRADDAGVPATIAGDGERAGPPPSAVGSEAAEADPARDAPATGKVAGHRADSSQGGAVEGAAEPAAEAVAEPSPDVSGTGLPARESEERHASTAAASRYDALPALRRDGVRSPDAPEAVEKPPLASSGTANGGAPPRDDAGGGEARDGTITLRDLLDGVVEIGEIDVFYVHSVTADDRQGIWGIIQKGITENFARGISIDRGERNSVFRFDVPHDADEVLENEFSSPLGVMIYRKSKETILYNRRMGRLTRDPNVTIFPGNELIIVGFTADEIVALYNDFLIQYGR